jgi:hypothetical protein
MALFWISYGYSDDHDVDLLFLLQGKLRGKTPLFFSFSFFFFFCYSNFVYWGIKDLNLCPSINQSPIRATQRTDEPVDQPASISSEVTPVVHTLRPAPAPPRLHHHSPLLGG